jgi:transcriptional regulator with XRE-family HTH domain
MKRIRTAVGHALVKARAEAGMSQYDLAAKSGVARQTIANIVVGIHETSKLSTLAALAAALGVPVSNLTPDVQGAEAPPYFARFIASDWFRVAKPTPDEIEWLRSLPEIQWLGGEPTDETFYRMLEGLRARSKIDR